LAIGTKACDEAGVGFAVLSGVSEGADEAARETVKNIDLPAAVDGSEEGRIVARCRGTKFFDKRAAVAYEGELRPGCGERHLTITATRVPYVASVPSTSRNGEDQPAVATVESA